MKMKEKIEELIKEYKANIAKYEAILNDEDGSLDEGQQTELMCWEEFIEDLKGLLCNL